MKLVNCYVALSSEEYLRFRKATGTIGLMRHNI